MINLDECEQNARVMKTCNSFAPPETTRGMAIVIIKLCQSLREALARIGELEQDTPEETEAFNVIWPPVDIGGSD